MDDGSTVRLASARGRARARADVVGQTEEDARSQMHPGDFEVGEVTERDEPDVDPGAVIAQSPTGGPQARRRAAAIT